VKSLDCGTIYPTFDAKLLTVLLIGLAVHKTKTKAWIMKPSIYRYGKY
jgi:hypothetical protein